MSRNVVRALANGPATVAELADQANAPRSKAHALLRHWERQGLTRYLGSDRWDLTDSGRGYARRIIARTFDKTGATR